MPALPFLPQESKRVGIWIRVSTEDQAQGDSPEHHRARAEHYCASKDWQVVEIYDLAGVSGKSVMNHAETKRMLADVKRGHIQALVFSKLARLTRNARELMDFSDYFRSHGADLVSLQESIDTSTPSGRLFYNMVAAMAQWEREEIVDRVRASVAIRAKLGKPLGGRAPFGYRWDEKSLGPDPKEAPIRRLLYEIYAECKRLKGTSRRLNEAGHRTRDGHKWSDNSVERLLRDPTAKGIYRSNHTRNLGRKWEVKPESEHVLHSIEPIISEELWQKCNDLLDNRKASRNKPAKPSVHVFTGVLRCACGGKMYVFSNSPKYVCVKCRHRIPCEDLEELFREKVRDYCIAPATLKSYVEKVNAGLQEKEDLAKSMRKDISRLKEESDHILKLYMDRKISSDRFGEMDGPANDRRKQLEAELPKVEAQIALLTIDGLSQESLAAEATNLYERWPGLTVQEKHDLVELIARSITVSNDEVNIELIHFPSFQEAEIRQCSDWLHCLFSLLIFNIVDVFLGATRSW